MAEAQPANTAPDANITIDIEHLRNYKVMIGTPCYGGMVSSAYTQSVSHAAGMFAANGLILRTVFLNNESLVQRARNYVVDAFLRSDCTHLLFIDADIGFHPAFIAQMLMLQTKFPEKFDILVGPYPKKTIAWEKVDAVSKSGKIENPQDLSQFAGDFVINLKPGKTSFKIAEPVEVLEGGTGFMMIPREVFEKFAEAFPEKAYKPDHHRTEHFDGSRMIHAYFDCVIDPESKRYLSEDYYFCRKVVEMGGKLHLCPWMTLDHVGTYVYRGNFAATAALGQSPTVSKAVADQHKKSYVNKGSKKKKPLFRA